MIELTLDQALIKGVEAHKAGKLQEADRYYTAILKAQPKHPDANHNMGVLAVAVDKIQEALPFFKTALKANPSIAQFWLSYIDALIKLNQISDAQATLDQVRSKGLECESFDKIEKKLSQAWLIAGYQSHKEILDKANELLENGKYNEAIVFLKNSISNFPSNPNIPSILSRCYILNDDLKEAIIYLEKAKRLNPNIASVGWNETRILFIPKKK
ncbi:MAG: tetratricopeptide repeat protein [Paracoccaceae bacterium]